jgi:NifU-like protein involved in Fe-S cluster formation
VQTIHDYFQRACRRKPEPFSGVPGTTCLDSDGNSAMFWLQLHGDRIVSAQFRCTTCCTLMGLCEHASELLAGMTVAEAENWTARRLLVLHPEIPAMRYGRAVLAAEAIRVAAQHAKKETYS